MAFIIYKLEHNDGTPADPPTCAAPRGRPGTQATGSRWAANELSGFSTGALDENLMVILCRCWPRVWMGKASTTTRRMARIGHRRLAP